MSSPDRAPEQISQRTFESFWKAIPAEAKGSLSKNAKMVLELIFTRRAEAAGFMAHDFVGKCKPELKTRRAPASETKALVKAIQDLAKAGILGAAVEGRYPIGSGEYWKDAEVPAPIAEVAPAPVAPEAPKPFAPEAAAPVIESAAPAATEVPVAQTASVTTPEAAAVESLSLSEEVKNAATAELAQKLKRRSIGTSPANNKSMLSAIVSVIKKQRGLDFNVDALRAAFNSGDLADGTTVIFRDRLYWHADMIPKPGAAAPATTEAPVATEAAAVTTPSVAPETAPTFESKRADIDHYLIGSLLKEEPEGIAFGVVVDGVHKRLNQWGVPMSLAEVNEAIKDGALANGRSIFWKDGFYYSGEDYRAKFKAPKAPAPAPEPVAPAAPAAVEVAPTAEAEPEFLSVAEVLKRLKIDENKLRRLVDEGELRLFRIDPTKHADDVNREDLANWQFRPADVAELDHTGARSEAETGIIDLSKKDEGGPATNDVLFEESDEEVPVKPAAPKAPTPEKKKKTEGWQSWDQIPENARHELARAMFNYLRREKYLAGNVVKELGEAFRRIANEDLIGFEGQSATIAGLLIEQGLARVVEEEAVGKRVVLNDEFKAGAFLPYEDALSEVRAVNVIAKAREQAEQARAEAEKAPASKEAVDAVAETHPDVQKFWLSLMAMNAASLRPDFRTIGRAMGYEPKVVEEGKEARFTHQELDNIFAVIRDFVRLGVLRVENVPSSRKQGTTYERYFFNVRPRQGMTLAQAVDEAKARAAEGLVYDHGREVAYEQYREKLQVFSEIYKQVLPEFTRVSDLFEKAVDRTAFMATRRYNRQLNGIVRKLKRLDARVFRVLRYVRSGKVAQRLYEELFKGVWEEMQRVHAKNDLAYEKWEKWRNQKPPAKTEEAVLSDAGIAVVGGSIAEEEDVPDEAREVLDDATGETEEILKTASDEDGDDDRDDTPVPGVLSPEEIERIAKAPRVTQPPLADRLAGHRASVAAAPAAGARDPRIVGEIRNTPGYRTPADIPSRTDYAGSSNSWTFDLSGGKSRLVSAEAGPAPKGPEVVRNTPVAPASVPRSESPEAVAAKPSPTPEAAIEALGRGDVAALEAYAATIKDEKARHEVMQLVGAYKEVAAAISRHEALPGVNDPDRKLRERTEHLRFLESELAKNNALAGVTSSREKSMDRYMQVATGASGLRRALIKIPVIGSLFKTSPERQSEKMLRTLLENQKPHIYRTDSGYEVSPEIVDKMYGWNQRRQERTEGRISRIEDEIAEVHGEIEALERLRVTIGARAAYENRLNDLRRDLAKRLGVDEGAVSSSPEIVSIDRLQPNAKFWEAFKPEQKEGMKRIIETALKKQPAVLYMPVTLGGVTDADKLKIYAYAVLADEMGYKFSGQVKTVRGSGRAEVELERKS